MITFLYSTVSVISAISYMPQLWRIFQNESPCHDISLKTWWIWNYMSFVSMLYGVFEIQDFTMSLVTGVNFFFINCTIASVLYKRRKYSDMVLISEDVIQEFSDEISEVSDLSDELGTV